MKCRDCPEEAEEGRIRCAIHRADAARRNAESAKARDRRHREERIAAGLCPRCWSDCKPRPGFKTCRPCAIAAAAHAANYAGQRRARGICARCPNPATRYTECASCRRARSK